MHSNTQSRRSTPVAHWREHRGHPDPTIASQYQERSERMSLIKPLQLLSHNRRMFYHLETKKKATKGNQVEIKVSKSFNMCINMFIHMYPNTHHKQTNTRNKKLKIDIKTTQSWSSNKHINGYAGRVGYNFTNVGHNQDLRLYVRLTSRPRESVSLKF